MPARHWLGSSLLAVALASCGTAGHHPSAGTPLSGTYLVQATFNTGKPAPACDAVSGATVGDPVTVDDGDGNRLASGSLGAPQSSTRPADLRNLTTQLPCRWPFTTGPVPNRPSYRIGVAANSPKAYQRADLVNQHWNITIELERNITDLP